MDAPRFGIWALVSGATGSLFHPDDLPDASWERNKRLVLEAEALGFESTLLAQHLFHVRDDARDQLETWTSCAALAALTDRIELIAAIKPGLFHPAVLAKMATEIEEISHGRFAINLVNAWYMPEFQRAGLPFPPHDARYAYGTEWLRIFRALSAGETVSCKGEHFAIDELRLRPAGRYRPRPVIYAGGESEPARALAAELADVWFMNGQSLEKIAALIADVRGRPRHGPALRFAMSAFVIARDTDAEATAAHDAALELARQDAPLLQRTLAAADPANVMFKPLGGGEAPQIGTNGGTAAGLVGSYDTVAARICDFWMAGVELFMLQFQPFEAEMRRFASEVRPRVARLIDVTHRH
ncbi:MAG TPA: LLM class flavin-dependent oxidoreductase [Acetobacteraceae bacterium]|nr:LLM class flavin-dependent oxidoreductase [Acetobacteraceae bacterium]